MREREKERVRERERESEREEKREDERDIKRVRDSVTSLDVRFQWTTKTPGKRF